MSAPLSNFWDNRHIEHSTKMDPYFLMTEIKKAGLLPGYIVANALNARHFGNHYNLAKLETNMDYAIHSVKRLLQGIGE